MHSRSRKIPVEGPLDLKATLRPLHGFFGRDGWWFPARTPDGPGSIRLSRPTIGMVEGEAWGDGGSWLLERLDAFAGLEDDPRTFTTHDPLVADLHRSHPGWRFARSGLVFPFLVNAIVAQKVTGQEARAAMKGLTAVFGEPAPGPNRDLRLPPDPELMAAAPYWRYHEMHLEKRRADVVRLVAAHAVDIDRLGAVEPGDAASSLLSFPGVGVWTVAKTLGPSHGDADQVEVGDFHLKHIVVHHLTGRARGTDAEMLELLEPFRPHRGRVVRLLHSLGPEPKFGPRARARDITTL
ncbi:MAG: DNA-3-methyladenine glycosylase 2 family protein [Acidimicrobiia bacterium]